MPLNQFQPSVQTILSARSGKGKPRISSLTALNSPSSQTFSSLFVISPFTTIPSTDALSPTHPPRSPYNSQRDLRLLSVSRLREGNCKVEKQLWRRGKGFCEHFRQGFALGGNTTYSHSMVAGGLLEMSKQTRLTPSTSLMMRLEIRSSNS